MSGGMPDFGGHNLPGVVEPGMYHVAIEEVSDAPSKSGLPMITIRFSIDGEVSMFSMWYTLKTKVGEDNEVSYGQLMQLSQALGLGLDGGYELDDLKGKRCGARLTMDGDFVRAGNFIDPDEATDVDWKNGSDSDVPF